MEGDACAAPDALVHRATDCASHRFHYKTLLVLAAAATVAAPSCKPKEQPGSSASSLTAGDDLRADSRYGSAVQTKAYSFGEEEKRALLALARGSVTAHLQGQALPQISSQLLAKYPVLSESRACFVTLHKHGELRGCIGSLEPRRALVEDVRQNAVAAAVHDSRFARVQEAELAEIDFEISVLEVPRVLQGVSVAELPAYLKTHRPGLIIEYKGRRSTFLPSVWESLPEPTDFLAHLCRKQGSSYDCWMAPEAIISTYGAVHFGEKDTP